MTLRNIQSRVFVSAIHRRCHVPPLIFDKSSCLEVETKQWAQIFHDPITGSHTPKKLVDVPCTLIESFKGWNLVQLADEAGSGSHLISVRRKSELHVPGVADLYGTARQRSAMDDVYRDFRASCKLREFADWFEDPQLLTQSNRMYLAGTPLTDFVPRGVGLRLPTDIQSRIIPHSPLVYFGRGNQQTPLHFDPTANLTVVVRGEKTFTLFPPSASMKLEPVGGILETMISWYGRWIPAVYSGLRIQDIDTDTLPNVRITLKAGEAIWIPSCWWHIVEGSQAQNGILVYGVRNI